MSSKVFTYDAFLSHSSKDKAVVRPLAERLHPKAEVRRMRFGMELQPFFGASLNQESHSSVLILLPFHVATIEGSLAEFPWTKTRAESRY